MFKRILVPTDGSPLAAQALPMALALGRSAAAEIHLLRSTEGMWLPLSAPAPVYGVHHGPYDWLPDAEVMAEITKEARASLDELIAAHSDPEVSWQPYIVDDDPAAAIVDHCTAHDIQLVVMSSHGHSGLERWALGSVTERVLRHAPCPVYVVRDLAPVRRMLLPLDGSPLAESALPAAFEVARLTGAHITLMRVERHEPPPAHRRQLAQLENSVGETLHGGVGERAEHYLQSVAGRHGAGGAPLEIAVADGNPANAILDYAAAHNIELIAMATHGRSGLRRWLYGSVTEKVLRASTCSLLIVRPEPQDEAPPSVGE